MTAHAKLSPSSAHRWIACPGSVQLAAQFPDKGSIYADEGTQAHSAAEILGRHRFGYIDGDECDAQLDDLANGPAAAYDFEEILLNATALIDYVETRAREIDAVLVLFERRMDSGVEGVWGTSDVVLISMDTVEIIDLKYGQGVRVDAWGNEQLRFYALGALLTYGDLFNDTESVTYTVFQPRLDHISSETLTVAELVEWRDTVAVPQAAKAAAGSNEFAPSESTCRWCPAKGRCKAQVEAFAALDFAEDVSLLSPDDLGVLLHRAEEAASWAKDIKAAADALAIEQGTPIPGWKVVRSGGKRGWKDEEAAIAAAVAAGYDADDVSTELTGRKIKGIGMVEKKLGKEKFTQILGEFAPKGEGKPSLVPEDNPQPALDKQAEAVADFL